MKSFLQTNNIEMYSMHNEGKSVVTERFIRTLTNKIYKYYVAISRNVYIDKLDDIVNKYNNTYHSTIKTYQITYIESRKEIYYEDPKFKVIAIVTISKYKNIFAKCYVFKLV